MARFRVEIFKRLGGEGWENRYHIETVSFTTAPANVQDIVDSERAIHSESVLFEYARVSTLVEGDDLFLNIPLNVGGLVPGSTTGGLLPLWNVIKLYFHKDLQRPDYKLFRGCLGEANSESGTVSSGFQSTVINAFSPLITSDPKVIWPEEGTGYVDLSIDPLIRPRDLHRRKRQVSSPPLAGT